MSREPFAGIRLDHVAGFEIADGMGESTLITPADLQQDAAELGDTHPVQAAQMLSRERQEDFLSEEFILRNIIFRMLTVDIRGDRELGMPPVTFDTTLRNNFVTRRDTHGEFADASRMFSGDTAMRTHSARFVPIEGAVAAVSYRADRRLSSWGVGMFQALPNVTKLVLHNDLYAEIYHVPQQDELPALPMPHEVLGS